jgi:cob(I)alamin adenosyltransferase
LIYTRGGDKGETSIIGKRVKKDDAFVEAYGTLDELNSLLGLAVSLSPSLKEVLENVQKHLYFISAELAGGDKKISELEVLEIEKLIDKYSEDLPTLKKFIIPGGSRVSSYIHVARTVCRRAERRAVAAETREEVLAYLNRLSDLLFVLARVENSGSEKFFE